MHVVKGGARLVLAASALAICAAAAAQETTTYTYDALGRLVATGSTGTVNDGVATTIAYDPAGNRSTYAVDLDGFTPPPSGPSFSVGDSAAAVEGSAHGFTVTRSGDTTVSASVSYATANGTAAAPGDYTAISGTLSFAAGETSKTVSVSSVNDTVVETSETFTLNLSNASSGASIADGQGVATITDNDSGGGGGSATFSVSDAGTWGEGISFTFIVTRAGDTTTAVSVSYATAPDTALSPGDFTAKSGTLSFAAGETSKSVSVATFDDIQAEFDEAFTMNLSSPSSGASITDAQGIATIVDNDMGANATAVEDVTAEETVVDDGGG